MLRSKHFLGDGEAALQQRFCLFNTALCQIQKGKVAEGRAHVWVLWPQRFLGNGEAALVQSVSASWLRFSF